MLVCWRRGRGGTQQRSEGLLAPPAETLEMIKPLFLVFFLFHSGWWWSGSSWSPAGVLLRLKVPAEAEVSRSWSPVSSSVAGRAGDAAAERQNTHRTQPLTGLRHTYYHRNTWTWFSAVLILTDAELTLAHLPADTGSSDTVLSRHDAGRRRPSARFCLRRRMGGVCVRWFTEAGEQWRCDFYPACCGAAAAADCDSS